MQALVVIADLTVSIDRRLAAANTSFMGLIVRVTYNIRGAPVMIIYLQHFSFSLPPLHQTQRSN
jgi:hypothetical protein